MRLEPGRQLACYRLVEKIGEGGVGVVWKAIDTRLGREVAIKVLAEQRGWDPERSARLEREARMLAALNHPNIAGIHGLEEDGGVRFLALEFVPGETLGERLARGPLPVDESTANSPHHPEATEAAHEQRILHRDLKPANVKITPDGTVKVLDFGLAKASEPLSEPAQPLSPTLTDDLTRAGVIMGTTAYMSPEQARGLPLDKRTDIWSLGCILFECLSGQRAFQGPSVSDTLVRILEHEPDWEALPARVPRPLRTLLQRCLRKDPRERLRDAGDARIILSETPAAGEVEDRAPRAQRAKRGVALGVAALLAAASIGYLAGRWGSRPGDGAAGPILSAEVSLPAGARLTVLEHTSLALAADGSRLAFVASDAEGTRLYVRDMASGETRPLPGTEDGSGPFFSPDGEWVGFFSTPGLSLRKVRLDGGAPVDICSASVSSRGASWLPDGRIVFTQGYSSGLSIVPADGGEPATLTTLAPGEKTHRLPEHLPDGRTVLFTVGTSDISSYEDGKIAALSLETGETRVLVEGGTAPRYVAPGYLVYAREDGLHAVRIDPATGELRGTAVRVRADVVVSPSQGTAQFAVSRQGTLVYAAGDAAFEACPIVAFDRDGNRQRLGVPERPFQRVQLSPDGRRLALGVEGANADTWIYDLERETFSRVTRGWDNELPIWTHDGTGVVFLSTRNGQPDVFEQPVDGSGGARPLVSSEQSELPETISPDGRWLLFLTTNPETSVDIRRIALDGGSAQEDLIATPFAEFQPAVSPDGRWLAYASDESGRPEVYVTSFPEPRGRFQVSNSGGEHPLWSRDGSELYYRQGTHLMVVRVETGSGFSAGKPRSLFEAAAFENLPRIRVMDLTEDGRFLIPDWGEIPAIGSLRIVLGWDRELEARLGAG